MADKSYLDKKYFIDSDVYNCPYCNRNNVKYTLVTYNYFDWTESKRCYVCFVKCDSCHNVSMHLSYSDIIEYRGRNDYIFKDDIDIDSNIFYSVPTSFFVIDSRIPMILRELITEAEGCIKMNFLTVASACTRKAIYELTIKENAEGTDYEEKIKFLKNKYPNIDSDLFDILCKIKDMTSDKVHEQSWDKWDTKHLVLFIETLKSILYEIYVQPNEKKQRSSHIQKLLQKIKKKPEVNTNETSKEENE